MKQEIRKVLSKAIRDRWTVTFLTGAGISAESGIPTFRGPEGFWTVGSADYHPQEMATYRMFRKNPDEVWRWYLYRMGICRKAEPNPGHLALVEIEALLEGRFTLITQNVDNLHVRAGNRNENLYQIHGNVFFMRCADACTDRVYPIPESVEPKTKTAAMTDRDRKLLRCPACGARARPHVLWFDETYNETHYRFESSLKAALNTDLLIIVGTAGATNLPNQVAWTVIQNGGVTIDVNIEPTRFTDMARASGRGFFIQEPSGTALPRMLEVLRSS